MLLGFLMAEQATWIRRQVLTNLAHRWGCGYADEVCGEQVVLRGAVCVDEKESKREEVNVARSMWSAAGEGLTHEPR